MKKILLGLTVVLALVCVLALAISASDYKIPVRDGWEADGGPTGAVKGDTASGWEASGFADIDNHVSFSRGENDVWVQIATNSTTNLKSGKYNLTYGNGYRAYFNEYEKKVVMVATGTLHSQLYSYATQSTPAALMTTAKKYALYDKLYNLFALEYIFTRDAFKDIDVPGLDMSWAEYMSGKIKASDISSVDFPSSISDSNADTYTNYPVVNMERAIANALYTLYGTNGDYTAAFADTTTTYTGSTYKPATDKQKMSRALLTGLVIHASNLGAGDTSDVAAAAKAYAEETVVKYYLAKGNGVSFGWSGGAENYFGEGGYIAMAFLINTKTSENAMVGGLGAYVETLEIRNSSTSVRALQNIGSVFVAFDNVTTVLLDKTISAIHSEGSNSSDRALFRMMDSITTVAHVTFDKNGEYTGEVKAGVFDFSGFTETKNANNLYIGHIGRQSPSITEAVLFETLVMSGVDYSGVIQNSTLRETRGLIKVTIPANASTPLTEIRAAAFQDSGLKELYVLRSVADTFTVASDAFKNCSGVTMYVLDATSAKNAQNALAKAGVKNVSVELFNPIENPVSFDGALVKMKDFTSASSDKRAIRFQFTWEEKGEAALANAGYTFKNLGIIASTAATYESYKAQVESETGLTLPSLVAQEMLAKAGTDGSKVVQVLVTNADFTDGRRTFLKGYDEESGYYPFCLSLYGMTGDQITAEYYVSAYTVWEDAAGNTYYTFTGIDYTKDGETKNSISLYDATLGLAKLGLINGSDYESDEDAEKYFYSVLEKGAYTTSSFTNHTTAAKNGYNQFLNTDGSFTYWNVDYRNYALDSSVSGGSLSAGWGFKPDTVEATSTSGVKFSILKDGAKYVVLITKDKNAADGATYTVPVAGRSSQYYYYQPFHYKYGDVGSATANAKSVMTVYSPAVTQSVFNSITTIVVDDGIVALGADSLSAVTSATTYVLPESCTVVNSYSVSKNTALTDIIWTGDPDAKSEEKYNVEHLFDLRGCTTVGHSSFLSDNKAVENVVTSVSVKVSDQLTFNNTTNLERYWSTKGYAGYEKPDAGVIDLSLSTMGTINKGYLNTGSNINTIIVQGTLKISHNKFTSTEDERSYRPLGKALNCNIVLTDSTGKKIDYVWNGASASGNTQFLTSLYTLIADLKAGARTAEQANCDNLSVNGVSVKTIFPDLFQ